MNQLEEDGTGGGTDPISNIGHIPAGNIDAWNMLNDESYIAR